ncbi:MAG: PIN domain-containing protein [Bacteroidales bacterium]
MKRLLIDTNIVLDLLARREPFYRAAAEIFTLADQRKFKLTVSSLTFANTNYVLCKQRTEVEAREILRKFRTLVHVLPLNDKIVDLALNDSILEDFEDSLQYHTAVENHQHAIITRNVRDFRGVEYPVMNGDEFLSSLRSNKGKRP